MGKTKKQRMNSVATWPTAMQRASIILITIALTACITPRGFIESSFELASESRLPTWADVPESKKREDVSLSLSYYTPFSKSLDDAVFWLSIKGKGGKTLTGQSWWHPRTKKELDVFYATEPRPEYFHPAYVVVEIGGQIDVIEHREYAQQNRDPLRALFWMTDDAVIIQEALDSKRESVSGIKQTKRLEQCTITNQLRPTPASQARLASAVRHHLE